MILCGEIRSFACMSVRKSYIRVSVCVYFVCEICMRCACKWGYLSERVMCVRFVSVSNVE